MVFLCAVLFPMRCLGLDLGLNWVSFLGFFYLFLSNFPIDIWDKLWDLIRPVPEVSVLT